MEKRYRPVNRDALDRLRVLARKYKWVNDPAKMAAKAKGNAELLDSFYTIKELFEAVLELDRYTMNAVKLAEEAILDERAFRDVVLGTPEGTELVAHLRLVKPELFRSLEEKRGYSA